MSLLSPVQMFEPPERTTTLGGEPKSQNIGSLLDEEDCLKSIALKESEGRWVGIKNKISFYKAVIFVCYQLET